jgi:hypothetical protein
MRYDIGRWTMVGGSSGAPDTGNPGNCGTELELRDSGVSALPGGIGELAGLRVLNLFGNGGTTLPAGLGRLPNLVGGALPLRLPRAGPPRGSASARGPDRAAGSPARDGRAAAAPRPATRDVPQSKWRSLDLDNIL